MYHVYHTDEYSKSEATQLVAARDEMTNMNVTAMKCKKAFSDERIEKQNKPFVWGNKEHYKDYIQDKESTFFKSESKESPDSFIMKMQKKSTDPNKPLTTSGEPSHYTEFVTKLDYLVEKAIELAKSSGDVSVFRKNSEGTQNLIRNKSVVRVKSKILPQKNYNDSDNITNEKFTKALDNRKFEESFPSHKQYSNVSHFVLNHTPKLADDEDKVLKLDPQYLTYRMASKTDSLMEPKVPPILNDSIKYIRVSSKDFNKSEISIGSLKKTLETALCEKQASINGLTKCLEKEGNKFGSHLSHDTISESLNFNGYIMPIETNNEAEKETFRILISGHLTREAPVFIVQNYLGSSALIKDSLDFRAHKKQGNVDISLAGKFFHDNILIENKGRPSALDLTSHRLVIDRNSAVAHERFKHVFNLGLLDAILEGEFVANSETLQYIPILSLEVMKHKPSVKVNFGESTTAIETHKENAIDSFRDEESTTDEQENTKMLHSSREHKPKMKNKKPKESIFIKLKESIFLLFKNKGSNSNGSQNTTSSVRKSNKKGSKKTEETKLEEDQKPKKIESFEISEVNSNNDSCSSPRKVHTEEKAREKKSMKKKQNKRGKIVENPGVSQMQGFFFQT